MPSRICVVKFLVKCLWTLSLHGFHCDQFHWRRIIFRDLGTVRKASYPCKVKFLVKCLWTISLHGFHRDQFHWRRIIFRDIGTVRKASYPLKPFGTSQFLLILPSLSNLKVTLLCTRKRHRITFYLTLPNWKASALEPFIRDIVDHCQSPLSPKLSIRWRKGVFMSLSTIREITRGYKWWKLTRTINSVSFKNTLVHTDVYTRLKQLNIISVSPFVALGRRHSFVGFEIYVEERILLAWNQFYF